MKASEKIIDAIIALMEGYTELQSAIEADFSSTENEEDEEFDIAEEVDAAMVTELRTALESAIDTEDLPTEDIAGMLSGMTEALEEIDPDVFEGDEEIEEDEDDEVALYLEDDEDEYFEDDDELEDFDEDEEDYDEFDE